MTSAVAWLDASSAEQRRVREIVALFTQQESRDELGLGQVRDVFSDRLFPGTSVIQTRARYFLIVPWLFERARQRNLAPSKVTGWVQNEERRLIQTLKDAGVVDGLIGRIAGPAVKVLPSTIYWSGLQRWGIVQAGLAPEQVAVRRGLGLDGLGDERAERQGGAWHPTLPAPPAGFPGSLDSLDPMGDEAAWLIERVLDMAPHSLLAQLVTAGEPLVAASAAPWDDETCVRLAGLAAGDLRHARSFSLCVHGAALLYNLLVAERYEQVGLTRVTGKVDEYRELLKVWADEVAAESALATWDVEEFWSVVRLDNPRVSPLTRQFIDLWIDVARGAPDGVADHQALRSVVAERERFQKRAQSRLSNDRLLAGWAGASAATALTFRWPLVHRLVTDIHRGIGVLDAGA